MALASVAPERWLRPAVPADVPAMAELINRYAAEGLMLPKTPEALFRSIRDFVVVVDMTGALCACGGLRIYSAESAEIVGLAVSPAWHGRGLGGLVVDRLVADARALDVGRVFAMTLSEGFFARHGFRGIPRGLLPEKERADCRSCPRQVGCREVAVQRILAGRDAADHRPRPADEPSGRRRRDLPVVRRAQA